MTLTHANHSSTHADGTYAGESCGFVVELAGRLDDLLRRRHERLRRHVADRADLRARRRGAADRRPLHDGPARGGRRARAPRRPPRRAVPLRDVPAADRDAGRCCAACCPPRSSSSLPRRARRCRCDGRERWFGATGPQGPGARARRHGRRRPARSCSTASPTWPRCTRPTQAASRSSCAPAPSRRSRRLSRDRRSRACSSPTRALLHARPGRSHLWVVAPSSRRTRSAPATSTPASGASRPSRSSSRSARSSPGPPRRWARSRPSRTPTRATAPTGSHLLRSGCSADEVVERLTAADDDREQRQLGVVDAAGRGATYTGSECHDVGRRTGG